MRAGLALVALLIGAHLLGATAAWNQGRFADAFEAFARAEDEAGPDASPELLYDVALAALRAERPLEAEIAAEKLAVRGGRSARPIRDFIQGNAAFLRCRRAKVLAARPEAGPPAFDAAIAYAESARRHWQRAAISRDDWPEACRNVERALLELEELKKQREEAARRRKKDRDRKKPPPPEPPPPIEPETEESEPIQKVAPQEAELSPAQVRRLLEKLREKEREKREVRTAERRARRREVERDW